MNFGIFRNKESKKAKQSKYFKGEFLPILVRKAIRAILRNKKSYISCIMLMAFGISFYIGFSAVSENLAISRDEYYENNRLADVFVEVIGISGSDIDKLYNIEGINEVLPREVKDFRVELPNNDNITKVRLLSSDIRSSTDQSVRINQYIVDGEDLQDEKDILLNVEFMDLNNLEIGDTVSIINNGKETEFLITGSVMSPEYVYLMSSATEFLPDKSLFGFGYVSTEAMASLANTSNYNNIVIDLNDGVKFEDIKNQLEDSLAENGLITVYDKEDNLSYMMLDTELTSISGMATSIPFVFLLMVIVILYLTLSRVIEQERMEIGMLKAFGYSNNQILSHYLVYGLIVGVIGGAIGCLLGLSMSSSLLTMYLTYFLMPVSETVSIAPYIIGFILAIVCGLVGTYFGVRKVLKLSPVESMKPPAPKIELKKASKNKLLKVVFKTYGFMSLRNIQRNKLRSGFIVLGVAFSFAMGAFMASASSMTEGMMFVQIDKVKTYDAKVSFNKPVNETAVEYFQDYDGVTIANGIYETPVILRKGDKTVGSNLIGIGDEVSLYKIYDEGLKTNKKVSDDGLVLCSYYAKKLDVSVGDYIYLSSPYLDKSIKVRVTDIAEMTMADAVYMDLDNLYSVFNTSGYTSVILKTNNSKALKDDLKNASNISSIEDKETTYNNLKTMMSSYDIMFKFMDSITIIIVFLIIYNISTISFAERSREYATLKIIGVSTKEISEIVNLEFWLLTCLGMFFGIFLAMGLKYSIGQMMDIDNFSMDAKLHYIEVVKATLECVIAVFLSNFMNRKNVKKLDLIEVLKERG